MTITNFERGMGNYENQQSIADALKLLSERLSNKSVSMAAWSIIAEEIRKYDNEYPLQVCEKKPRNKVRTGLTFGEIESWLERNRMGFYLGCRVDTHSPQVNEFVRGLLYYLRKDFPESATKTENEGGGE